MNDMGSMCEHADMLAKIKHAAKIEFGKEAEITFIEGKRVDSNGDCWKCKQIHFSEQYGDDLLSYRLDVMKGEINGHTIFNLNQDSVEDVIGRKFEALNLSIEECKKVLV